MGSAYSKAPPIIELLSDDPEAIWEITIRYNGTIFYRSQA